MKSKNLILEYNIPIIESVEVNNEFIIQGIAINETITSNGHQFIAEELEKATSTLKGVPLLKDHENRVDAIVGRVVYSEFNNSLNNIMFKAKVIDKQMKEMIKDGRLNSVSVGAAVEELEESDNGSIIPRGITFKELSLVAVPADSGATFGVALMEAYNKMHEADRDEKENKKEEPKSHSSEDDSKKMKGGKSKMTEEQTETKTEPEQVEEPKEEPVEEPKEEKEEPKEEPKEESEEVSENLKKSIKEAVKSALKESDEDESEEESEEDEDEDIKESYKLESGYGSLKGNSVTVVRNSYR